ncbi:MAG: type II toxin-antitoxin system VapC family toxin [Blastocatellia bacterium]|nr:type II toxin-antitoxin system VapC family toxin [Blastocatellia bacterium]
MRPTVYIETSVISYLTARPSRDLIVAGHQQITADWWDNVRAQVDFFISPFVIDEASRGDQEAARRRIAAITDFPVLEVNEEVRDLAQVYFEAINLPDRARIDAFHLAVAVWHGMDYLLTWNCKHIASARVRKILAEVNETMGIRTSVVCTPEELMEV